MINNKYFKMYIIFIIIVLITFFFYNFFNIGQKIYRIIYPKRYEEYINEYSEEYEMDPMLILAIIKTESNFNENAVSKSGAIGLMQLMNETAEEIAQKMEVEYSKEKLYDPKLNIMLGTNYYNSLLQYYNNNYILAFTAYNAGIGNVDKWIKEEIIKEDGSDIENIPFKETNLYVRKIIRNYEIYKKIYKN